MQDNRLRPPLWRVAPKMGQTWARLRGRSAKALATAPVPLCRIARRHGAVGMPKRCLDSGVRHARVDGPLAVRVA